MAHAKTSSIFLRIEKWRHLDGEVWGGMLGAIGDLALIQLAVEKLLQLPAIFFHDLDNS
jgi:hypothetical protein